LKLEQLNEQILIEKKFMLTLPGVALKEKLQEEKVNLVKV